MNETDSVAPRLASGRWQYGAGLCVVWLCMTATATAGIPMYELVEIPTFGGTLSAAYGVNQNGESVGYARYGAIPSAAYHFHQGVMTDLGTLGGSSSEARAINDHGQIIGVSTTATSSQSRAFIFQQGTMQMLGTPWGQWASAEDINDQGQVAGWAFNNSAEAVACVWQSGTLTTLESVAGNNQDSYAVAINELGHVLGYSDTVALDHVTETRATLWRNGEILNLGRLSQFDSSSFGRDINDHGVVIGRSGNSSFSWTEAGGMIALQTLGGNNTEAFAINNLNQIVGSSQYATGGGDATIWENGAIHVLEDYVSNPNGWDLWNAWDISDNGHIVGVGRNPQGATRGFLLVPIPEPASIGMLTLAGLMVLGHRRR